MPITFITKANKNLIISLAVLMVFASITFFYTASIRRPWFGTLSNDRSGHQWLTASTLKFSQYWFDEGPSNLYFGLIENPPSIEFPTLKSRVPYGSYPPGTILPIYLLAKIVGHAPTVPMAMGYNLFQHFMITITLSIFTLLILTGWGVHIVAATIYAAIPIVIYQLLPGTLYWHQNVFWADQAVILPFLLTMLLEYVRDKHSSKRILIETAQGILILISVLIDWLSFFIVAALLTKRLFFDKNGRRSAIFVIIPFLIGVGLFAIQIVNLSLWEGLVKKFWERTDLEHVGKSGCVHFFQEFWLTHIPYGYGKIGLLLLFLSITACFISILIIIVRKMFNKKGPGKLYDFCKICYLLIIPCLMQVTILKNHSAVHNFSALKFALIIALMPFVLIPVIILLNINKKLTSQMSITAAVIMFALSLLYIIPVHQRYKQMFPSPYGFFEELGSFLSQNTVQEDIVFSTKGSIGSNPPQFLFYSKKRVYQVDNALHIFYITKDLPGPFNICILNNGGPEPEDIQKLISLAFDVRHDQNGLLLYKIRGK